ncbi:hypothetical protein [Gluconobacter albidus]|uniref:hypothetical protein n=1 Tax=Gluconobacter albidus TaxID=318683 RepID=UPI001B8D5AC8|nr:hypothetical protein [Gluconobacter albidus]MBS1026839.1 hypothetical protein [Gluconobacter albidus]
MIYYGDVRPLWRSIEENGIPTWLTCDEELAVIEAQFGNAEQQAAELRSSGSDVIVTKFECQAATLELHNLIERRYPETPLWQTANRRLLASTLKRLRQNCLSKVACNFT